MRKVRVRLIHDGAQPGPPLDEALSFGAQDVEGRVHPGAAATDGTRRFAVDLDVKAGRTDHPIFGGPFAHEPPATRLLYLSWKRDGAAAAPWGWRIKLPLSSIGWVDVEAAERDSMALVADATGRRPHSAELVVWRVEPGCDRGALRADRRARRCPSPADERAARPCSTP